ncbi:Galactose-1-phosphate uridyl transferase, class I [Trema orientale]|uniref:Galactose-1-phosphate uridyl transferase, class I n=1 Tax=Trema orientale TaxID=63057 RepID=A0A2P5FJJ9_TREOI|nr:Galactose-1-phosphate uridyl transferase, class I [Trema orientale]
MSMNALSRSSGFRLITRIGKFEISRTCTLCRSRVGFYDVVIESPLHSIQLSDLSPLEIGEVAFAYRSRILQIARCEPVEYV